MTSDKYVTLLQHFSALAQQVYAHRAFHSGEVKNLHTNIKGQAIRYFLCVMRVHFITCWRSAARGHVMPICTLD